MKRRLSVIAVIAGLAGLLVFWPDPGVPAPPPAPDPETRSVPRAFQSTPLTTVAEPQEDEPLEPEQMSPQDVLDHIAEVGEPADFSLVEVRVFTDRGDPVIGARILGRGCIAHGATDADGRAISLVDGAPCEIQARRWDGLLSARSDWVEVDLEPGEAGEAALILPSARTGGLGVQIAEHEEGIEVVRVHPGTPADDMALVAGDVIVEVDGLPTSTLTTDEFIEIMTGPEGSEVEFVLAYEEDTGFSEETLTLTRAWLGPQILQW